MQNNKARKLKDVNSFVALGLKRKLINTATLLDDLVLGSKYITTVVAMKKLHLTGGIKSRSLTP